MTGDAKQSLNTWKEISLYLDCVVRIAQRWEALFAFPVRRADGKSRSRVLAFRAEIDKWLKSNFFPRCLHNPRHLAGYHLERKISRHARRHSEISEPFLRAKAIRRDIMESHRALSVAAAQLEAPIYRWVCKVENRPQAEIGSITKIDPDHSSWITA